MSPRFVPFFLSALIASLASVAQAGFESPARTPSTKPAPGDQRNWDFSIRPFIGFDSNVQLVPDESLFDGDQSSFMGGLSANGRVQRRIEEKWTLGAGIAVQQIWYSEEQSDRDPAVNNDHDEYDLLVVQPVLSLGYQDTFTGKPVSVTSTYTIRGENGEVSAIGLDAHTLGLSASVEAIPNLSVSLGYSHAWTDHDVDFGADEDANGRDSKRHSVSLSARYRWDGNRRSVGLGYGFSHNDADGDNFDSDSHSLSAEISSHLIAALWGRVQFSVQFADYDGPGFGFIDENRKNQQVFGTGVALIWVFTQRISADVFFQRQDTDSNAANYRSDRNHVGGGVTYRF